MNVISMKKYTEKIKSTIAVRKRAFTESPYSFLWFFFFLIIILTLFPFFRIGFTTADDLEYYMSTRGGTVFQDAYWYARGAGRFYFLITKPLYHVPYLIDNFYFTKIIQYSFLLLSFILFGVVIQKIFRQKEFSLLIFLFLLAFLPVTRNFHIPIIAYPFFFTLSFSIFLVSLLYLLKYLEAGKTKFLTLSVVFLTVVLLFYEAYLIFLAFIVGFLLFRGISKQGKQAFTSKAFYKEILPFCVIGVAYVAVYFLYRRSVQPEDGFYTGTTFVKDFNVSHFFDILWNYNKSAIPTNGYRAGRMAIAVTTPLVDGHRDSFLYILTHSPIRVIVNALLQCFVFVFLLKRITPSISWKKLGLGALIALLIAFAVHLPIAISDKYNSSDFWYKYHGYVTTLYSYFCFTTFFGIIVYASFKAGYNKKWLRHTITTVAALLFFYAAILIGYGNEYLSKNWEHSQNRFKVMDYVLDKGIFDNIPDNAIIYSGDMTESVSTLDRGLCGQGFTWKRYVFVKTGRKLNMFDDIEAFSKELQKNPEKEAYCLNKYEAQKSNDILLVLANVNQYSINTEDEKDIFHTATSNKAQVYYYSPYKNFRLGFFIPDCSEEPVLSVNAIQAGKSSCGANVISIVNNNKRAPITSFTLESDKPFLTRSFLVSDIGYADTETFQLN